MTILTSISSMYLISLTKTYIVDSVKLMNNSRIAIASTEVTHNKWERKKAIHMSPFRSRLNKPKRSNDCLVVRVLWLSVLRSARGKRAVQHCYWPFSRTLGHAQGSYPQNLDPYPTVTHLLTLDARLPARLEGIYSHRINISQCINTHRLIVHSHCQDVFTLS